MITKSRHRPLYPRERNLMRIVLYRRLGRSEGQTGRVQKISHSQGFDPQTVKYTDRHYTVYDTLAQLITIMVIKKIYIYITLL